MENQKMESLKGLNPVDLGERLYQWRDLTAIPIVFILLFIAQPNVGSATIGILVVILGFGLRVYCRGFILAERSEGDDMEDQSIFHTSGPYALVRNPMYLGNFIMTLGVLIFSGQAWFSVIAVGAFCFQYYYIVKYEESLLLERHGDAYERYRNAVPAWIPSRWPQKEDFPMIAAFWPALELERRAAIAVALIIFGLILVAN